MITRARIAFLGNAPWSVPPLAALAAAYEVVFVGTNDPRAPRRSGDPVPTPVAMAARGLDIPVFEGATVSTGPGWEALSECSPDILVVVAYGEILPAHVLALPPMGALNLHFSLLPAYRGASPVQSALLDGHDTTGITIIRLSAGMDTGPVLLQQVESIAPEDDAGSLGARLAIRGAELLVRAVRAVVDGTATFTEQDDALASIAPKLTAKDRVIDWSETTTACLGRIRAFAPEVGATTTFRGRGLKVLRASADGPTPVPLDGRVVRPGSVVDGARPSIATADGAIALLEVAPQDRKVMSGRSFAQGARLVEGEIFGAGVG